MTKMKKAMWAAAAALAITGGALAGASLTTADPDKSDDANTVINDLKAHGYRVIVTKTGDRDLSQCKVISVDHQSAVKDAKASRDEQNEPTVVQKSGQRVAHVALQC